MRNKLYLKPFFLRGGLLGLFAAFTLLGVHLDAQPKRLGDDGVGPSMETIDLAEGVRRIERFRHQRLDGDFRFQFELEHLPRRAKTVHFYGTLWGSWNEMGAINRFRIEPVEGYLDEVVELIVQSGPYPRVWKRAGLAGNFVLLEGDALFEPVIPGIVYTPFDLQMPFVYWTEFSYQGPDRVRSRTVQQFLMYPPMDSIYRERGIASVRMGLDDVYDTLLFAEVQDASEVIISEFSVDRWKKVDGRYIVKQITLEDMGSKDRTRFIVHDATVGLNLPEQTFQPTVEVDTQSYTPLLPSESNVSE